jgi:hypothetical protein
LVSEGKKGNEAPTQDDLGGPLGEEDFRTWLGPGLAFNLAHVQGEPLNILDDSGPEVPTVLAEALGE